jgi:hypothetical protein
MKRLFAVAAVALSAAVGFADDRPVVGGSAALPPGASLAPTVSGPVYQPAPAASPRRGLFGRLRNRGTTNYSAPQMAAPVAAPVVVPAPTPAPAVVPAPMTAPQPMPGVKPAGAVVVPGDVVQAGGPVAQAQPVRRGLFGRLRSR